MNHKRRKSRTKVRCTMCTKYRYGNGKDGKRPSQRRADMADRADRA